MTAKQQSIRLLAKLEHQFKGFTNQAFLSRHKQWLGNELVLFMQRNGLSQATPPGEGVRLEPAPENGNQSPSQRNFLQCPDSNTINDNGLYHRANEGVVPVLTQVSWSDGVQTVRDHKGLGLSVSGCEGQETSRVVVEAPGAKKGASQGGVEEVNKLIAMVEAKPKEDFVAVAKEELAQLLKNAEFTLPTIQPATLEHTSMAQVLSEANPWPRQDLPVGDAKPQALMTAWQANTEPVAVPNTEPEPIVKKAEEWPEEARVSVLGRCLNPKLCQGALVEEGDRLGRKVTVWAARRFYRQGSILKCRLDLVQGTDARYLPV